MRFENDPEPFLQIRQALHAHRFSDQTRHAVSPFIVQAFNHAGFAAAFFAGAMLPGPKETRVGFMEITVNEFAPIARGHLEPHLLQRLFASVTHTPGQNLMGEPRNHQPQVAITPSETKAHHQFVQFQSIARNGRQNRLRKTQAALVRLFLSTRRTVSRPALKVRAMARCDKRSCKAFSIKASFSALMVRLLPSGDHVLRHAVQRKRCVPLRLKPNRITGSDKPQN